MKIVIATGIYPPKVGGPSQYAVNLEALWKKQGHDVRVVTYKLEDKLPPWIRHLLFLLRIVFVLPGSSFCLALDTYSTGIPAMIACKLLGKPFILRVGGDFLWESYLNRTNESIMLSDFYNTKRNLSLKEKIIFHLSKWLFKNASGIAFNTRWQANIFARPYALNMESVYVVENYYGPKAESQPPHRKNFLWHVRETFFKNKGVLEASFKQAKSKCQDVELEKGHISHRELMEKMMSCYAVIQPSISDVSPNYIIEALAYNKPAIMTEDTGLREKLEGVVVFVNPYDEEEIANAICKLCDPEAYQKQLERVRGFQFTHSWQDIASEFMGIYLNLNSNRQ